MQQIREYAVGKFERGDFNWIAWFVILIIVSLTLSIIDPEKAVGRVYKDVGFFVLILIGFAYMALKMRQKALPFSFQGISGGNFWVSVAIGFGISLLLVGKDLIGVHSFLSPLSIPTLTITGVGALGLIFMVSMYVSEVEESFRTSTVLPTLMNVVYQYNVALTLIVLGAVIYFILGSSTIGLTIFILGIVGYFTKWFEKFKSDYFVLIISLVMAALLFASLHIYAYTQAGGGVTFDLTSMLFSVFVYALLVDLINVYMKNTVASRIAHTINNGTLASVAAGLNPFLGIVIGAVHAGILYFLRESTYKPI